MKSLKTLTLLPLSEQFKREWIILAFVAVTAYTLTIIYILTIMLLYPSNYIGSNSMTGKINFFDRLVSDWVTVYRWNPRLYRRVAASGAVIGFLFAVMVFGVIACILFLVMYHG